VTSSASPPLLRIGAPVLFVLLWSTGFVGAKYGLPYAPPFTFLAVRLAAAAALLAALAAVLRSARLASTAQCGSAALAGLLLHAGYLGGVFYGISLGVPAGVAAVVVSMQPVLTAVLAARVLREHPTARQWLGLVVGVAGVALVVGPGILDDGAAAAFPVAGLVACLVALVSGTLGTVHQKRHGGAIPLIPGTAVQYAAAALLLVAVAAATEEMSIRWTAEFVAALVWLVLFLSIGAVLLLLVLLRHGSAARVSSLYYLVPPATAVEAYLLFGERVSGPSLFGIGVTALGSRWWSCRRGSGDRPRRGRFQGAPPAGNAPGSPQAIRRSRLIRSPSSSSRSPSMPAKRIRCGMARWASSASADSQFSYR
jgi:drug/metabolite transporter (DMT)-like permease